MQNLLCILKKDREKRWEALVKVWKAGNINVIKSAGEEVCLMHPHQREKAHTLSILDKEKKSTPWCVLFH